MANQPLFFSFLAATLITGCGPVERDVTLRPFSDCDDLKSYMTKMARHELMWGLGDGQNADGISIGRDMAMNESTMAGNDGADSYSTTNIQEEGVDEADLIKTDGSYIYAIAGGQLVISRAWPIEEAAQLSTTAIDGFPKGLYLLDDGDRLLVVSGLSWSAPNARSGHDASWRSDGQSTALTLLDISSRESPEVLRETYFSGALRASRRIDDRLLLVVHEDFPYDYNGRREARIALHDASAEDWQQQILDNVFNGESWDTSQRPACDCDQIWASEREGGNETTGIFTVDLSSATGAINATSVVGRADSVYASLDSLYVTYSDREFEPVTLRGATLDTIIHKLDLGGSNTIDYVATARVDGVLIDSFAMSERDNVLRIGVTDMEALSSGISTLTVQDETFIELDHLGGLAPGEVITAARFVGRMGYLVTYEQQLGDPLFTFDLTDPEDIVLGGELHVTGWSDYLHPMDEDHLLAIGMDQEAPSDSEWRVSASIFDVSDLSNPTLLQRELLDAWGSEAQGEHHAFNYFAETETLTVPVWSTSGHSALEVLTATPGELSSQGQLVQPSSLTEVDEWCTAIRRSIIMEDVVWATSSGGLTAASLESPTTVLATVAYDGVDPCYDMYGGWQEDW